MGTGEFLGIGDLAHLGIVMLGEGVRIRARDAHGILVRMVIETTARGNHDGRGAFAEKQFLVRLDTGSLAGLADLPLGNLAEVGLAAENLGEFQAAGVEHVTNHGGEEDGFVGGRDVVVLQVAVQPADQLGFSPVVHRFDEAQLFWSSGMKVLLTLPSVATSTSPRAPLSAVSAANSASVRHPSHDLRS